MMSMAMAVRNGGYHNYRNNGAVMDADDDDAPRREMAIDVPSDFVPQPKEKPRLTNSLSKDDKLKKYQSEVKSRKEQEMRIQREQDFLRASLRESKKLQNLEKRSAGAADSAANGSAVTADGFVNEAFDRDADESARINGAAGYSAASTMTAKEKALEGATVDIGDTVNTRQILNLLHALRVKLGSSSNELRVMDQLFNNVQFQDSIKLYNQVVEAKTDGRPVSRVHPEQISPQVCTAIRRAETPDSKKLKEIFSNPPFKGVLVDEESISGPVAVGHSEAISGEKADLYGDDTIKIVTINKTADPLGATVKNEGESVVIGRIVKGGVAEKSGVLHEGDEILEVNDIPLRGKTINEVSEMLAGMTGALQFVIVPNDVESPPNNELTDRMVSVRALFSYDPEEDQFIPCEELGVSFVTGDVLHIINQDDPNWWQAYREGEEDQTLAGLVPSKTFWENREQIRLKILADSKEAENQTLCCPTRRKKKKSQFNADDVDPEDILTYDEVTKYYPQPNRKRPIVLIGPPDVGRKELRQRLLESNSDRFAAAIPHTSRPRGEEEEDGKDYYFTAKHLFEADIRANKFVEHGHYQRDYYGTSLESIRTVVHSGKICVLNLHPQALKTIRSSDVKPYVIFISAPNLETLRLNIAKTTGKETSVEHCREVIDKGREMENKYGHFFDHIISSNDIDHAFVELLDEINRLEVEPQWVPSDWLK